MAANLRRIDNGYNSKGNTAENGGENSPHQVIRHISGNGWTLLGRLLYRFGGRVINGFSLAAVGLAAAGFTPAVHVIGLVAAIADHQVVARCDLLSTGAADSLTGYDCPAVVLEIARNRPATGQLPGRV